MTNRSKLLILMSLAFAMSFTLNMMQGTEIDRTHAKITKLEIENETQVNIIQKELQNKGIIFVWNDDEESIPKDGSLIQLEYTDENTVYIGPINNSKPDQMTLENKGILVDNF